mmetsp:Transcript_2692/g.7907  ORF Transcript_2692/g.7907 Transcript_2692/m.7907 type:complete len:215 (-) Transcript_2692:542-1186(-)
MRSQGWSTFRRPSLRARCLARRRSPAPVAGSIDRRILRNSSGSSDRSSFSSAQVKSCSAYSMTFAVSMATGRPLRRASGLRRSVHVAPRNRSRFEATAKAPRVHAKASKACRDTSCSSPSPRVRCAFMYVTRQPRMARMPELKQSMTHTSRTRHRRSYHSKSDHANVASPPSSSSRRLDVSMTHCWRSASSRSRSASRRSRAPRRPRRVSSTTA